MKFPPQYQSFVKRLHRPRRRKLPSDKGASKNRASETTDQHSVVLRAIASGTVVLETAQKETSMMIINESIAKEAQRTFLAIENMNSRLKLPETVLTLFQSSPPSLSVVTPFPF